MNELIRFFWNAAAVAGAAVVGVFTHDAGLIAVTFLGGLIVPRMLGLVPRHRWLGFAGPGWGRGGWGRGVWGSSGPRGCGGWQGGRGGRQRFDSWHQEQHGQQATPPAAPPASTI